MRILFLGGTGIISTACTRLAVENGMDVTLLTRGRRVATATPAGVKTLCLDIEDSATAERTLEGIPGVWDAVVDWIAFTPEQVERDLRLFGQGRTRQYIFISSASAYQKPPEHYLITESTPLANPHWQYSRDKIACEELLMRAYRENGFPATIVRPSLTYGDTQIPLAMNVWEKPYTIVERMRRGAKVIVPGEGTSLWTITHNTDFAKGLVGLLGHRQATGQAFHITSDEVMTWDQYYTITAEAAGVCEPKLVHIPSEFLARCIPEKQGSLVGDKSVSAIFDNSKIKRFVPGYCATTPYARGIRRTLEWFDAAERRLVDERASAQWDAVIEAWEAGLCEGLRRFHQA